MTTAISRPRYSIDGIAATDLRFFDSALAPGRSACTGHRAVRAPAVALQQPFFDPQMAAWTGLEAAEVVTSLGAAPTP